MLNSSTSRNLIFFSLCGAFLLSLVLYLPLHGFSVFEAPDENGNYLATRLYADTGQLWYSEDYTELDIENYLHPRQFVSYEDKIVPTQFFGLPVIYGPLYSIAGDSVTIVWSAVFSLLSFIFFIKLASLLFGKKSRKYAALIFIGNIPLLYYLNMPYFNVAPAICFFICGCYYLAKFYYSEMNRYLLVGLLFFSLSIFFRYEYAIFIALLLFITLINKYGMNLKAYVKPIAMSIGVVIFFALVPILATNNYVYGDSLTFGTQLLESYSIEREASGFLQIFFPNPITLGVIWTNVYRLLFRLLPLISLLSLLGITLCIRNKKIDRYKLLYGVLFIYLLVYSGSSETWKAFDFSYLGLIISIIRYWLIAYIFLALMAVAGFTFIKGKHRILLPLVVIALIATSVSTLFIDNERSLVTLSNVHSNNQKMAEIIPAEIDQKAIVYTDTYDKVLAPFGIKVATWWNQSETYDPDKLADSMERVHQETDYKVYLLTYSSYVEIEELNLILNEKNLFLEESQNVEYLYEMKEV